MSFEFISKGSEIIPKIIDLTEKSTTSFNKITTSADKIVSSVGDIPKGLLELTTSEFGKISILPTISIPEVPLPTNPLSNIEIPTFSVTDLIPSSSGSLLSMLMSAITMIIDNAIAGVVKSLNEAISMFMTISDSIKDIMTWLWDYLKDLWSSLANIRNIWENNKFDLASKGDKVSRYKATLWERALQWFDDTIKNKLGPAVTDLKNAVTDFVKFLEEAPDAIYDIIKDLGESLGMISDDWDTLTSTALMAVKYR